MNASTLWQSYQHLRLAEPKIRIRDAAAKLAVSEAQLVACDPLALTLYPNWAEILGSLEPLGPVMCLTRNEAAVHEKTGVYANVSFNNQQVGLALNPDIDLRIFLKEWRYGFAVRGERCSLQFFDAYGEAVHKIYLTEQSNLSEYDLLVKRYASALAPIQIDDRRGQSEEVADSSVAVVDFRAAWMAMQDAHEFFPLLRRFNLSRMQALRLAPDGMVREVSTDVVADLLQRAANTHLSIMAFVGSHGCIQIHTGPVQRIVSMGPWLNVLDPGFNLHLRMDLFKRAYVVSKPGRDGGVTSLECYDAHGNLIVQFFGARKPGKPELSGWRELVQSLGMETTGAD